MGMSGIIARRRITSLATMSYSRRRPYYWPLLVFLCLFSCFNINGRTGVTLVYGWTCPSPGCHFKKSRFHGCRRRTGSLAATETVSPTITPYNLTTSSHKTDMVVETVNAASNNVIMVGSSGEKGQDADDSLADTLDGSAEEVVNEGNEKWEESDRTRMQTALRTSMMIGQKLEGSSKTHRPGKDTSVGAKRIGSATLARSKQRRTRKLLGAVHTVAAAVSSPSSSAGSTEVTNTTASKEKDSSGVSSSSLLNASTIQFGIADILQKRDAPKSDTNVPPEGMNTIQSAISDLLTKRQAAKQLSGAENDDASSTNSFFAPFGKDVEVNLDPLSHELLRNPMPGTILLHPSTATTLAQPTPESLTIRLATPNDDLDIATLRLSVFSDFTSDIRKNFVSRSGQVLASRRLRGATCIVCSIPTCTDENVKVNRPEVVLGSVECSVHEFDGTWLGQLRPACSVLYVTEVAVSPSARRCGVGTKLMQGVDELATLRGTETLYLHVDQLNTGALELYRKAGYEKVDEQNPIYKEFTMSLNLHDGATKGRCHFLLQKNLASPTWLASEPLVDISHAPLGFEIPM